MKRSILAVLALTLTCSIASADFLGDVGNVVNEGVRISTGGAIDPGKGKYCAPPVCIQDGGVKVQTPEELTESVLGQVIPGYAALPQSERDKIRKVAMTTGLILIATSTDPITGAIIIKLVMGENAQEVPVPTHNPNPTPTPVKYVLEATCMVQRDARNITVAFSEDHPDLQKIKVGDTLGLTSPMCEFPGSISSALVVATSEATKVNGGNGSRFKWIILGAIKQE